jgi:hypothetical protein
MSGDTSPWVAILTPVRNGWEFLEQCAMSVFLQETSWNGDRFTWEWWIGVNGHGPTGGLAMEKALKVKEAYEQSGHTAGAVHVVNLGDCGGKVNALNLLVKRTEAPWVALLDCDDTWERKKLLFQRLAARRLEPQRPAAIGTLCWYFGEMLSEGPPGLQVGWVPPESVWTMNPLINSSVLMRREYALWYDRFGLEDYDLWLRMTAFGCRFYNIPYRLVHHRIHAGSAFNGKGGQDLPGLLEFHRRVSTLSMASLQKKDGHSCDGVLSDQK